MAGPLDFSLTWFALFFSFFSRCSSAYKGIAIDSLGSFHEPCFNITREWWGETVIQDPQEEVLVRQFTHVFSNGIACLHGVWGGGDLPKRRPCPIIESPAL